MTTLEQTDSKKLLLVGVVIEKMETGRERYLFKYDTNLSDFEQFLKTSYEDLQKRDKKKLQKDSPSWKKYKDTMTDILEVKDKGFNLVTPGWTNTHIMVVNLTFFHDKSFLGLNDLIHNAINHYNEEYDYSHIQHFITGNL